jgi:hypothetical protein
VSCSGNVSEGRRTWPRLGAVVHNLSYFYADLLPSLAPYCLLQALSRLRYQAETQSEKSRREDRSREVRDSGCQLEPSESTVTGRNQLCPTEALSIKESGKELRFESCFESHSNGKRACSWAQEAPMGLRGPAVPTTRADSIGSRLCFRLASSSGPKLDKRW